MTYFLIFFAKSLIASPTWSENVMWVPQDPQTSLAFARVLGALPENLRELTQIQGSGAVTEANCRLSVLRPSAGEDAVVDPQSAAVCDLKNAVGPRGTVRMSLGTEPIYYWGNRFAPKGFFIRGEIAKSLWLTMQQLEAKEAMIQHEVASVSSAVDIYLWEDYKLVTPDDEKGDHLLVMLCTREYWFKQGTPKPEIPSDERCQFTYQFHVTP